MFPLFLTLVRVAVPLHDTRVPPDSRRDHIDRLLVGVLGPPPFANVRSTF